MKKLLLILVLIAIRQSVTVEAQSLQLASTISFNSGALDVAAGTGAAYVGNFGDNTLRIIDTTDPSRPRLRGTFTNPNQRVRSVLINGTTAYLGCYGIGAPSNYAIQAVDVSNPAAPVATRSVSILVQGLGIGGLATSGALVCAASPQGEFFTYDTALNLLSTLAIAKNPTSVAVSGSLAYITDGNSNALQIVDLSTPTTPILRSTTPAGTLPTRVLVRGNTAYVASDQGISVLDVTDPAKPMLQGTYMLSFATLDGSRAYGFRNGILQVFELGTALGPTLSTSTATNNRVAVRASGTTVYALGAGSLEVYQYDPVVTSTKSVKRAAFQLYPNPAVQNRVTLELPKASDRKQVDLFTSQGQLLRQVNITVGATQVDLDLTNLPAGVYLVRYGDKVQQLVRQ